jgi:hypothetical protein
MTLTLPEISAALRDVRPQFSLDARLDSLLSSVNDRTDRLILRNSGAAACRLGDRALVVLLRVPPGSVHRAASGDGIVAEPVFQDNGSTVPCTFRRANAIRVRAKCWPPGAKASLQIEFTGAAAREFDLQFRAITDAGDIVTGGRTLKTTGAG